MKKRRMAMPGAPSHPEHLGPPPGPVTRKQKSLISSPRPRSSPGRCSGPGPFTLHGYVTFSKFLLMPRANNFLFKDIV